jgi:hypothetical protein
MSVKFLAQRKTTAVIQSAINPYIIMTDLFMHVCICKEYVNKISGTQIARITADDFSDQSKVSFTMIGKSSKPV